MQKISFNGLDRNVLLDDDEQILFQEKPVKFFFITRKNKVPWLLALIWFLFDFTAIIVIGIDTKELLEFLLTLVGISFHMIPCWIWLAGALSRNKEYKAINYIVTNKRIIATNISTTLKASFSEITEVNFSETKHSKIGAISFSVPKKQTIKFEGIKNPSKKYANIRLVVDNGIK